MSRNRLRDEPEPPVRRRNLDEPQGRQPNAPPTRQSSPPPLDEPLNLRRSAPRTAPSMDDDLFLDEPAPHQTPTVLDEPKPQPRAANDDRSSVGQILQTLQRRPSRGAYMAALLFSLGWTALAVGLSWSYLGDLRVLLSEGMAAAQTRCGK